MVLTNCSVKIVIVKSNKTSNYLAQVVIESIGFIAFK